MLADSDVDRGILPVSEGFCDPLLGLPIGPQLHLGEIYQVAYAVLECLIG